MPTRVTFRVKRGSSLSVNERAKSSGRPTFLVFVFAILPVMYAITVQAKVLCGAEPSSDPHLSHSASTSSITSKQWRSQGGTSDNAGMCALEGRVVGSDIDSLSNQDSESPAMNDVFSELQNEEELEYEGVAQSSTSHGPAAIPFVLNKNQKKKNLSWDERFMELVNFKAINGHTKVAVMSGPLGKWVDTQRQAFRGLKEGKNILLTSDKCEKLETIGFEFKCRPTTPWDQRFQELVDFKKINGHTNVHQRSGPLWTWVSNQQSHYRVLKEGKPSPLTNGRRDKLEKALDYFSIFIKNH
eukprot:scaffold3644_cov58-Attheya_sp.AAC.4